MGSVYSQWTMICSLVSKMNQQITDYKEGLVTHSKKSSKEINQAEFEQFQAKKMLSI